MTFAIFIVLVLGLFIGALNVLPAASALGFSFEPSVQTIVSYMNAWNFMFPIHELFTYLGIFVAFEIAVWVWKITMGTVKIVRRHSDGA